MKDLYTSSFYPFRTQEEKWAYWAKHISLNLFETKVKELYISLMKLVSVKDYFVIPTNVEGQFRKAGVDRSRFFEIQGNYGYFQCEKGCHDKLYNNEQLVVQMLSETSDCRIPSTLVPKCPVCGAIWKSICVRIDFSFRTAIGTHLKVITGISSPGLKANQLYFLNLVSVTIRRHNKVPFRSYGL